MESKEQMIRRLVHMVECDFDEHWDRLLFRDFLIQRPDLAREYAAIKREQAARNKHDRAAYARHKTEFIVSTTEAAREAIDRPPADG